MKFAIKFNEIDQGAAHKVYDVVDFFTKLLTPYLNKRDYGKDVLSYKMICICVKTKPGYEDWYKVRRPKYIENQTIIVDFTGEKIEINNELVHEIKIDNEEYDFFVSSGKEEGYKFLAYKILRSISELKKLPGKIKDFDKERFKSDLEGFFKEKGLV